MIPDRLVNFKFWCQQIIPLVYDNSLSHYELLCKVMEYINNIIDGQNSLIGQVEINTDDIAELKKVVSELQKILEDQNYLEIVKEWIDENLQQIINNTVKFISFGLSDDGYFMACIPSTWDFLSFDTIMDLDSECYGSLVLKW